MSTARARVMCVDDEPLVIEGVRQYLARAFDFEGFTDPLQALARIKSQPFEVIISDMRMPQMDGARFLEAVAQVHPDSARILLTGQADLEAAADAVNRGRIHRFLTKPCPPPQLISAVREGVDSAANKTLERNLLEQTLKGSLQVMLSSVAHFQPEVFGHAQRVARVAQTVFGAMDLPFGWAEDIAANVWPLGAMGFPLEVVRERLAQEDIVRHLDFVRGLPARAAKQLAPIPRLGPVTEILVGMYNGERAEFFGNEIVTSVMRGCLELSLHLSSGTEPAMAVAAAAECVPHDVKVAMEKAMGCIASIPVMPVRSDQLEPGMRLARDVKTTNGVLLMCAGMALDATHIERLASYVDGDLRGQIFVEKPTVDTDGFFVA